MNDLQELLNNPFRSGGSGRDYLPIIIAVLIIVALLIVWAIYLRKKPHRSERGVLYSGDPSSGSQGGRRRRRRKRHRNPTLAETGGLPPPRVPSPSPESQRYGSQSQHHP